jgi:hypothetical protein
MLHKRGLIALLMSQLESFSIDRKMTSTSGVHLKTAIFFKHMIIRVGSEVITAVGTNVSIFWDVAPCSP